MAENNLVSNGENGLCEQARPAEEKIRSHPRTKGQIQQVRSVIMIQKHVRAWLKARAERPQENPKLVKMDTGELQERLEAWEASVKVSKAQHNMNMHWTQSQKFTLTIGMVVLINAVTLGIEADHGKQYPKMFFILENIFTSVFTAEVIAHFLVEGPRIYFSDRMNWLDFCLVCFSILDVWIFGLIDIDADLRIMSIFRMLRLVRLGRLLRLFRIFKELTLILSGFLASIRTLFWALTFLLILVYSFSIFARQIIGFRVKCPDVDGEEVDCERDDPAAESYYTFNPEIGDQDSLFGGVDRAMVTLFVCLTDGCGIDIIHPVVLKTPWLIAFWTIFVFFTTFGLLNLIVGLFCENAMKTSAENDRAILKSREAQRRKTLQALRQAFEEMDVDGSGTISKSEFQEAILDNVNVQNSLEELGIDQEENLFETLDADNSGVITFDQFFDGAMLIMKGHESAKAKDMVGVHLLCQSLARRCTKLQEMYTNIKEQRETTSSTLMVVQAKNKDNMRCIKQMSVQIGALGEEISMIKEAIISKDSCLDSPSA